MSPINGDANLNLAAWPTLAAGQDVMPVQQQNMLVPVQSLPNSISNARDLLDAHTLLLGPDQTPSAGDVVATE